MASKKAKAMRRQYEIAGRLLLLRVRLFSKASDMARSVKLTPQMWYNVETGRRALDPEIADRIVEKHGVNYDWLFSGKDVPMSDETRALVFGEGPPPKPARRKQRKSGARKS